MSSPNDPTLSEAALQERFARLLRYGPLRSGLPLWQSCSIALVGLGGLGCAIAPWLARFGAARLTLIDRDIVGTENLGHQGLFTEQHAAQALPKARAAAEVLAQYNSALRLDAQVADLSRHNIRELLAGCSLIFDGLDNYYTRLLLNDYAWASATPLFYAGVVGGEMSARALLPGRTGCLRCLLDRPPPPGSMPTCSSAGVFPPLLGLAAMLQIELANRWLLMDSGSTPEKQGWEDLLYSFDLPHLRMRQLGLTARADCPVCSSPPGEGRYDYLDGLFDERALSACDGTRQQLELGRPLDLGLAREALQAAGGFVLRSSPFSLAAERSGLRYTLFPQGRLVLEGSSDPAELNRFLDTYLGA